MSVCQVYMDTLMKHWVLTCSEAVKKFLDPDNYAGNLHGKFTNFTNLWLQLGELQNKH